MGHVRTSLAPYVLAAAVVIAGPLAFATHSGERLAIDGQGRLVLTRWQFWGLRERVVGQLDGIGDHWWITSPAGETSPWTWAAAPQHRVK